MELRELVKEKLVIEKNKKYYVNRGEDDGEEFIGFKPDAKSFADDLTQKELSSLVPFMEVEVTEDTKLIEDSSQNRSDIPNSSGRRPKKALIPPNKHDAMMGEIMDINIHSQQKGDTSIYINGVNQMAFENPVVKACPLFFYWNLKKYNVQNSKKLTNKGMTVVSKTIHGGLFKEYNITVNRDDTPLEAMYCVGELVMCVMKKDQYLAKKELQRLKGVVLRTKEMAKRQELATNQAKESDVELMSRMLKTANEKDRTASSGDMNASADMDKILSSNLSTEEKAKLIDGIDIKDGIQVTGI